MSSFCLGQGAAAVFRNARVPPVKDDPEWALLIFVLMACRKYRKHFVTLTEIQEAGLAMATGRLMAVNDAAASASAAAKTAAIVADDPNRHLQSALIMCTSPDVLARALLRMEESGVLTSREGSLFTLPEQEEPSIHSASQFRAALLDDEVAGAAITRSRAISKLLGAALVLDSDGSYVYSWVEREFWLLFAEHFDVLVEPALEGDDTGFDVIFELLAKESSAEFFAEYSGSASPETENSDE